MGALRKNNGKIEPETVLRDANTFLETEVKHFTVLYEHPDAKPLADKLLYGGFDTAYLKRKFMMTYKSYHNETGKTMDKDMAEALGERIIKYATEEREKASALLQSEDEVSIGDVVRNDADDKAKNNEREKIPGVDLEDKNTNVEYAPIHDDKGASVDLSNKAIN